MKKSIHILLLAAFPIAALFAAAPQTSSHLSSADADSLRPLKPPVGDIGFGIKAAGLKGLVWENRFDSVSLQLRKIHSRLLTLRLDLTIYGRGEKVSEKDAYTSGGYNYASLETKGWAIGLSPGIERHFDGTRRLDPYVGVAVSVAVAGRLKETEVDDDINANDTWFKRETQRSQPGGFGIGLDGLVGINFFVAERLSVGIEYGLGFSILRFGGKVRSKVTTRSKPVATGAETITIVEQNDDEATLRSSYFGNRGVAGLQMAFYLGR